MNKLQRRLKIHRRRQAQKIKWQTMYREYFCPFADIIDTTVSDTEKESTKLQQRLAAYKLKQIKRQMIYKKLCLSRLSDIFNAVVLNKGKGSTKLQQRLSAYKYQRSVTNKADTMYERYLRMACVFTAVFIIIFYISLPVDTTSFFTSAAYSDHLNLVTGQEYKTETMMQALALIDEEFAETEEATETEEITDIEEIDQTEEGTDTQEITATQEGTETNEGSDTEENKDSQKVAQVEEAAGENSHPKENEDTENNALIPDAKDTQKKPTNSEESISEGNHTNTEQ